MVIKDKNYIFRAFIKILSSFKSFNNSYKLWIISFILNFGQNFFFKLNFLKILLIKFLFNLNQI